MTHKFRLSTDILSPIHSDISLNDASAFSFESSINSPSWDMESKLSGNKSVDKVQLKTASKDTFELNGIWNDIDNQFTRSAANSEKFKGTYEQLKKSMDDLLCNKTEDASIFSPISNKEKCLSAENINYECKAKEQKVMLLDELVKTSLPLVSECPPKMSKKLDENISKSKKEKKDFEMKTASHSKISMEMPGQKVNLDSDKVKNSSRSVVSNSSAKAVKHKVTKSASQFRESLKKQDEKANFGNELDGKGDNRIQRSQKVKSAAKITDSAQDASLNKLRTAHENKSENLLSKYDKQRKNGNLAEGYENKELSIEKLIQIAVGLEVDKIRSLMFDQNNCLLKEMFKLQDMAKKQNEVNKHLFSVIENLMEENKRLMSRYK